MARPSVKEERRAQILDAFGRCVARYGVDGATLERVAEEAGLARALIRHNVGNREDLLAALVERFLEDTRRENEEMIAELPSRERLKTLIDWLFDPAYADAQATQLADALVTAAADDATLATDMREWTLDFVHSVESVARAEFPHADKKTIAAVAAGIVGIYFNADSLTPLGKMSNFLRASRDAAHLLAQSLHR